MKITFRHYENPEDLHLQYEFWKRRTRSLPFSWKATTSPSQFKEQPEFDPRSRWFAFDGDKLVGYMSFTGQGSMVSLGYPWVLSDYKDHVQDELFKRVYNFAISEEYGGKVLAQRFRKQWDEQIKYFLQKGFTITSRSPLLGKEIKQPSSFLHKSLPYEITNHFNFSEWKQLAETNPEISNEEITMMKDDYSSVDFDFSISFTDGNKRVGYTGVTIRSDTGYAEAVAFIMDPSYEKKLTEMFICIEDEAAKRKANTIAVAEGNLHDSNVLLEKRYEQITEDVFVMKEV